MTLHKEGTKILLTTAIVLAAITIPVFLFVEIAWLKWAVLGAAIIIFLTFLQFFRVPGRTPVKDDKLVIAPADGKVVAIEEVEEHEYFNGAKRIQLSIFMSPTNVHVNWFPIPGIVRYFKYHPGLFLVAWHPKSSTDNERTTTVVQREANGPEILFRQIAGAVARRIVWYCKEGDSADQGQQMGFIKFGSRVDVLLPLDANIQVQIGDKTTGSITTIAELP